MGKKDYIVVTNNPLVREKLQDTHNIEYLDVSYEDILKEVRARVHKGYQLLSHPLSGSVKPNETPYKSVMVSVVKEKLDTDSLLIIENAVEACQKFEFKSDKYKPEVYSDFQEIDLTLLESGLESADLW